MFNFFGKKKKPESLNEVLKHLRRIEGDIENLTHNFEDFKEKSRRSLQKVGIVRFNPFKEGGGDQSFSIALLDEDHNGFVITSHYGRETNRVYAKAVTSGQSQYSLSEEEKEAIGKAIE